MKIENRNNRDHEDSKRGIFMIFFSFIGKTYCKKI